MIEFGVSFVDDPKEPHERKRDKDLPKKLESEVEGILAWLVRGCLDYQSQGLNPPETVTNATKEYQKAEDILNEFFDDCCVIGPALFVKCSALYVEYKKWCEENKTRTMSGVKFGRKINNKFLAAPYRQEGKVYKVYKGIALKSTEI